MTEETTIKSDNFYVKADGKIFECPVHGKMLVGDSSPSIFEVVLPSGKRDIKTYCMRCILEFLDKTFGEIKEIKDD